MAASRGGLEPAHLRALLERIREAYHRPELIHPDPLEIVRGYDDPRDREIAAVICSSLAFGRVERILVASRQVLERLDPPAQDLARTPPSRLRRRLAGFRHRFVTGEHVTALLVGVRAVMRRRGSLEAGFLAHDRPDAPDTRAGLAGLTAEIRTGAGADPGHLLPEPCRGSACKRLHLMLRWLVRRDAVDPGGWTDVRPARLVVPLDVHMHRVAVALGLTARRALDGRAAVEITRGFARLAPEDPVRWDFALTRAGIRGEGSLAALEREGVTV